MAELEQGTIIKLLNGKTCTVDSELGRGGQGIVYLVDYCGGDFALKWYTRDYSDSFYNNLKRNADSGAPSNAFLWPLAVTEKQKGSFGYIIKLRPRGYREFSDFMLAKVQFSSMAANINAAIKICDAFQKLHIRGLSYQDMNDGNFFINPRNGDVLICDNDNVAPDKTNLGIIGKVYDIYCKYPNNSRICENLSTLCNMCIIEYVIGDKYGKSGVKSILDKLKINKSAEFNKHCSVFKKTHNEIWNQLPFDAQQLLKGAGLSYGQTLNDKGYALKEGLEYYRSLGGFSLSTFDDDIFSILHHHH